MVGACQKPKLTQKAKVAKLKLRRVDWWASGVCVRSELKPDCGPRCRRTASDWSRQIAADGWDDAPSKNIDFAVGSLPKPNNTLQNMLLKISHIQSRE